MSLTVDILNEAEELTQSQANVLDVLRSLPARYRHQGRPGAPIKLTYLSSYDGRTLNALQQKGYISYTPYGVLVKAKE